MRLGLWCTAPPNLVPQADANAKSLHLFFPAEPAAVAKLAERGKL
jgi:hypothetical protein